MEKKRHGEIEIINHSTACVIELNIYQEAHPDTPLEITKTNVWMDYEVFDELKELIGRFNTISSTKLSNQPTAKNK